MLHHELVSVTIGCQRLEDEMIWGKTVIMLLTGTMIISIVGGVSAARLQPLGQPCRAKNILATAVVKDRASGRDMFVLSDMNETSNSELLFVDFENDTGKAYRAPAGSGSWALKEVPGDRLIVATFYDGVFMVFDLNKMEFVKVSDFVGETYIWNLALGNDGRVYGGTYPRGKLGALDLNDYSIEDLGSPAPPNLYLRNVHELPDGRVLCHFITEKPMALIFDPKTKKFDPAPAAISNGVFGTTFNGYFVTGRQVFDGKTLEEVKPIPFPTPPAEKGVWQFAQMTTPDVAYMQQGSSLYSYKKGDKDLKLVTDIYTYRAGIRHITSKGWALGLRGQDYIVIKPGSDKAELRPIPVESAPRMSMFLRVAPDGRLWGGPTFGQTLWWMDPETKKYVNTSTVSDAGGEVYDVAFSDNKVYAVSYARGETIEYDPSQPWDQVNHKNPRTICAFGTSHGYIRPESGAALGSDGKIYTGWLAKYGTYGGAVSVTDPKTGDYILIENPLGEQAIYGAIPGDDGLIYVGSSLAGNGLPIKKGESSRFGVVDPAAKKTIFQHEFTGSTSVQVLACDPGSNRVLISVDGNIKLFDTVKREFIEPSNAPVRSGRSVGQAKDGVVYYPSKASIAKIDMRTAKGSVYLETEKNVDNVACSADGKLYISCEVDVFAVVDDK